MKLGLLADIHEQVEYLRLALSGFSQCQVEQVVVIGDVFDRGHQIEKTCQLLEQADALGVWGNHDFGLSVDPDEEIRARYPDAVTNYMTSLQPALVVQGCHFSHVEPWLDPKAVVQLWYFDGPPDDQFKLNRIFHAVPHRLVFAGHLHQWLLARPDGVVDWTGEGPIRLHNGRYYVVVGALCEGWFATFDTCSSELVPFSVVD